MLVGHRASMFARQSSVRLAHRLAVVHQCESFEGRCEPRRLRPLRSNSQIHSQLAAVHESESGTFAPCKPTGPFVSFQRYFCRATVVVGPVDPDPYSPSIAHQVATQHWSSALPIGTSSLVRLSEPANRPELDERDVFQTVETPQGPVEALAS